MQTKYLTDMTKFQHMKQIDPGQTGLAEVLVQILDRTRELQLMATGNNFSMLNYLLNMVEQEAETMLMNEHEKTSGVFEKNNNQ